MSKILVVGSIIGLLCIALFLPGSAGRVFAGLPERLPGLIDGYFIELMSFQLFLVAILYPLGVTLLSGLIADRDTLETTTISSEETSGKRAAARLADVAFQSKRKLASHWLGIAVIVGWVLLSVLFILAYLAVGNGEVLFIRVIVIGLIYLVPGIFFYWRGSYVSEN